MPSVVDALAEGVEAYLNVGGGDVLAVVVFGEQPATEEYRDVDAVSFGQAVRAYGWARCLVKEPCAGWGREALIGLRAWVAAGT